MDNSPSVSCNASQFMMKSLMKSFNAGNVQFYENLHKKYFDKAKGNENNLDGPCEPPSQLLDITADNDGITSRVNEMSRFSGLGVSNISHVRQDLGQKSIIGTEEPHVEEVDASPPQEMCKVDGFHKDGIGNKKPVFNGPSHFDQTQGDGQTVLDDDSHLFELTEKTNNTYMALSYFNQTATT